MVYVMAAKRITEGIPYFRTSMEYDSAPSSLSDNKYHFKNKIQT